jgi:hypothetical protein
MCKHAYRYLMDIDVSSWMKGKLGLQVDRLKMVGPADVQIERGV